VDDLLCEGKIEICRPSGGLFNGAPLRATVGEEICASRFGVKEQIPGREVELFVQCVDGIAGVSRSAASQVDHLSRLSESATEPFTLALQGWDSALRREVIQDRLQREVDVPE
jgi:hypothetical protein